MVPGPQVDEGVEALVRGTGRGAQGGDPVISGRVGHRNPSSQRVPGLPGAHAGQEIPGGLAYRGKLPRPVAIKTR
ncbi:hypothetical protein JCM9957A_59910 [Kineosporia succinea]